MGEFKSKQEREFVSLQHDYKMQVSFFLILASVGAVTCASLIKTSSQTPLIQVHKDYAETVRKALNKSSIIPEVLDDFSPKCFVTAYYSKNSGKSREDPKWSEMCHWIYIIPTHFPSTTQKSLEFSIPSLDDSDSDLVEYKPPGPPPKTGYHRYVLVILEGDTTNLTAPDERQHWGTGKVRHGVRDWAEK